MKVPGFCYPKQIWYERVGADRNRLEWYGIGLWVAHDVYRMTGLEREFGPLQIVTNYSTPLVMGAAQGDLDVVNFQFGFNDQRQHLVDFGPTLAFMTSVIVTRKAIDIEG